MYGLVLLQKREVTHFGVGVAVKIFVLDPVNINLFLHRIALAQTVPALAHILCAEEHMAPAVEDLKLIVFVIKAIFGEHRLELIVKAIEVRREGGWDKHIKIIFDFHGFSDLVFTVVFVFGGEGNQVFSNFRELYLWINLRV